MERIGELSDHPEHFSNIKEGFDVGEFVDYARESGFPTADTFSRNFRQKYALTPSQFREQQVASE